MTRLPAALVVIHFLLVKLPNSVCSNCWKMKEVERSNILKRAWWGLTQKAGQVPLLEEGKDLLSIFLI